MPNPMIEIERIGLTYLFRVSSTGNRYYIPLPKAIVNEFELMVGDQLKIKLIEARKNREVHGDFLEEILTEKLKELREKKKKSDRTNL